MKFHQGILVLGLPGIKPFSVLHAFGLISAVPFGHGNLAPRPPHPLLPPPTAIAKEGRGQGMIASKLLKWFYRISFRPVTSDYLIVVQEVTGKVEVSSRPTGGSLKVE